MKSRFSIRHLLSVGVWVYTCNPQEAGAGDSQRSRLSLVSLKPVRAAGDWEKQVVVMVWTKGSPHTLLVVMQANLITMETSARMGAGGVSKKLKPYHVT